MAPGIRTLGFWVSGEIVNLHFAFPDSFPPKHFMHRHSLAPNRCAIVQVLNCRL